MNKFNYYYDGTPITSVGFKAKVPVGWEKNRNKHGEYSFGLYRAVKKDD